MNLQDLPPEILTIISEYLTGKEVLGLSKTSSILYSTFENQTFWKIKIMLDFPGEDMVVPESNYKKLYFELCNSVYFTIVILDAYPISDSVPDFINFNKYRFGESKNFYSKFSIFCMNVSSSKNNAYINIRKKISPPKNNVLVTDAYKKKFATSFWFEESQVLYMTEEDVNNLLSEENQVYSNVKNSFLHKINMNVCTGYDMGYILFGKRMKRNIKNIFIFTSTFIHLDFNSEYSKIEYINFFESRKEIRQWIRTGNLEKASSMITNTGRRYELTLPLSSERKRVPYLFLTQEIIREFRRNAFYKLHYTPNIYSKLEVYNFSMIDFDRFSFRELSKLKTDGYYSICHNQQIIRGTKFRS